MLNKKRVLDNYPALQQARHQTRGVRPSHRFQRLRLIVGELISA